QGNGGHRECQSRILRDGRARHGTGRSGISWLAQPVADRSRARPRELQRTFQEADHLEWLDQSVLRGGGHLIDCQSSPCWSVVMSEQAKIRILILGGGFAGLHAAMHLDDTLARDPDIEVTLVNRDNFFLFTPMLHEVAASDLDLTNIVNPVRKLLKRINFFAGEVERIDLENKVV